MEVISTEMQTRRGPGDWFVGDVWLETTSVPPPGAAFARVSFAPAARTNWHTHPEGQYLFILTGEGRVGSEDGTVTEVAAGDFVHFAPGERHWHGAGPETFMVHLAISPALDSDGATDWQEPVTDEQYDGR